MKNITVKEIIAFRGKSERSKKNFATNIKLNKEKTNSKGGGDYWVSCLSALSSSFKSGDLQIIADRNEELKERYANTEYSKTKNMYGRNISILNNYLGVDFKKWKPSKNLDYLKKAKDKTTITIKGIEVKVTPNHVFTYQKNDIDYIGAIWFVAQLNGFSKEELGIFADALYRYLKTNFSKKYTINSKYCTAVDVVNNNAVDYSQLDKMEVNALLSVTIDDIKGFM